MAMMKPNRKIPTLNPNTQARLSNSGPTGIDQLTAARVIRAGGYRRLITLLHLAPQADSRHDQRQSTHDQGHEFGGKLIHPQRGHDDYHHRDDQHQIHEESTFVPQCFLASRCLSQFFSGP